MPSASAGLAASAALRLAAVGTAPAATAASTGCAGALVIATALYKDEKSQANESMGRVIRNGLVLRTPSAIRVLMPSTVTTVVLA